MFKDVLLSLKGKKVTTIHTKSGDDWEDFVVRDVKDEYVEVIHEEGTLAWIRISSIESMWVYLENDEKEEEQ